MRIHDQHVPRPLRLRLFFALLVLGASAQAAESKLSEEAVLLPDPWQPGDCEGVSDYIAPGEKPIQHPCKLTRTAPPLEWGPDLLGLGKIEPGFEIPTGAVWQPALYLFGGYRSALAFVDSGSGEELVEWAHRADVALNLQLTATERLVLVMTPLHKDGRFTNYQWRPRAGEGWNDETNADINQFWFEGDFGELFPNADGARTSKDGARLEYGFSFGRQPLTFQDGMIMDDIIDSVGVVRNNLQTFAGSPSTRLTFIGGWDEINRGDNLEDPGARLLGVFGETDLRKSTVEVDLVYVKGGDRAGDGLNLGVGATQRLGYWNSTFRLLGSAALDESSSAVGDGALLFAELSRTPTGTHNVFYVTAFAAVNEYTSAARDPTRGGPLGRAGILFAPPGVGRFPSALSNRANESFGGAVGHQWFFRHERSNLVVELGWRRDELADSNSGAVGARYQYAFGRRWLWQSDIFYAGREGSKPAVGLRTELSIGF